MPAQSSPVCCRPLCTLGLSYVEICARERGRMFDIIEGEMADIFGLMGDVELCEWGKGRDWLYGTTVVPAFCMGVKLGL